MNDLTNTDLKNLLSITKGFQSMSELSDKLRSEINKREKVKV